MKPPDAPIPPRAAPPCSKSWLVRRKVPVISKPEATQSWRRGTQINADKKNKTKGFCFICVHLQPIGFSHLEFPGGAVAGFEVGFDGVLFGGPVFLVPVDAGIEAHGEV